MVESPEDGALRDLRARMTAILPEPYRESVERVQPVPMGSAGLKFNGDGTVAWDEMWGSFCHLAMAGGPPHKGTLLEPGPQAEIGAHPGRYRQVVDEICRGIGLVTGLEAEASRVAGWVRVECSGAGMAGWLARSIAMENVSVRCEGAALLLPAGAGYRLDKEIRNVVTAMAKTTHYWSDHMPPERRQEIAESFAERALLQPELAGFGFRAETYEPTFRRMAAALRHRTGCSVSELRYAGWLGVECASVAGAIWRMRAMAASHVLARREGTVLFVPVNPSLDPEGNALLEVFARVHRLAAVGAS